MEWGFFAFQSCLDCKLFFFFMAFLSAKNWITSALHMQCPYLFFDISFNDYSISKLFIALFTPNLNIHDKYHGLVTNAPSYRQERILHFNL